MNSSAASPKGWMSRFLSRLVLGRRDRTARGWNQRWARQDFERPWMGRGVSPEVKMAHERGWFPAPAKAIDLGCGEGDIAAWLAEQGYEAMGMDIAPAAIDRARDRFRHVTGQLEFQAHDLCVKPPPGGPYAVLIDRGCYHQISDRDLSIYSRHLAEASTDDAKLLLWHKAFRHGVPLGDHTERRRVEERVQRGLGQFFMVEKCELTYMDPYQGKRPDHIMPGLVFWMKRISPRKP